MQKFIKRWGKRTKWIRWIRCIRWIRWIRWIKRESKCRMMKSMTKKMIHTNKEKIQLRILKRQLNSMMIDKRKKNLWDVHPMLGDL